MSRICVLTDSSAQFSTHSFPGEKFVRLIPFDLEVDGTFYPDCKGVKVQGLPPSILKNGSTQLFAPSVEKYSTWYQALSKDFDQILVLCQSQLLSKSFENATVAAEMLNGNINVLPVNSQTTSVGLGALVQLVAQAIVQERSFEEIEQQLRSQIPHVYALFCTAGLSYVQNTGLIEPAQAVVGEMLNFITVFSLEEERLTPLEKIKNFRNINELFIEFLEEFDQLRQISFVQGVNTVVQETRGLKQALLELYPDTSYSEHTLNIPTALQFGPRMVGIIAVEILPRF